MSLEKVTAGAAEAKWLRIVAKTTTSRKVRPFTSNRVIVARFEGDPNLTKALTQRTGTRTGGTRQNPFKGNARWHSVCVSDLRVGAFFAALVLARNQLQNQAPSHSLRLAFLLAKECARRLCLGSNHEIAVV